MILNKFDKPHYFKSTESPSNARCAWLGCLSPYHVPAGKYLRNHKIEIDDEG